MPRILSFRLFCFWVAFTLDDYGKAADVSAGLTERHAIDRSARTARREGRRW